MVQEEYTDDELEEESVNEVVPEPKKPQVRFGDKQQPGRPQITRPGRPQREKYEAFYQKEASGVIDNVEKTLLFNEAPPWFTQFAAEVLNRLMRIENEIVK